MRLLHGWLGWCLHLALVALVVDGCLIGFGAVERSHTGHHMLAGFFVLLPLFLLHTVPYFFLAGAAGELLARAQTRPDDRELELARSAVGEKAAIFLPTLAVLGTGLAAGILGMAQLTGVVPPYVHGAVTVALTVLHVWVWRRVNLALGRVAELLYEADGARVSA